MLTRMRFSLVAAMTTATCTALQLTPSDADDVDQTLDALDLRLTGPLSFDALLRVGNG